MSLHAPQVPICRHTCVGEGEGLLSTPLSSVHVNRKDQGGSGGCPASSCLSGQPPWLLLPGSVGLRVSPKKARTSVSTLLSIWLTGTGLPPLTTVCPNTGHRAKYWGEASLTESLPLRAPSWPPDPRDSPAWMSWVKTKWRKTQEVELSPLLWSCRARAREGRG